MSAMTSITRPINSLYSKLCRALSMDLFGELWHHVDCLCFPCKPRTPGSEVGLQLLREMVSCLDQECVTGALFVLVLFCTPREHTRCAVHVSSSCKLNASFPFVLLQSQRDAAHRTRALPASVQTAQFFCCHHHQSSARPELPVLRPSVGNRLPDVFCFRGVALCSNSTTLQSIYSVHR